MTQQQTQTLKQGDKVTLIADANWHNNHFGHAKWIGAEVTVTRTDLPNDRVYFTPPDNSRETFVYSGQATLVVQKGKKKPARFSKADVARYQLEAGNARLQTELTTRIHAAKKELDGAVKPEDFGKQLNKVTEQLRQAKLIRSAIKL